MLSLPPARLVAYLSGADPELRNQIITACPPRIRKEIQEEPGLRPRVVDVSGRSPGVAEAVDLCGAFGNAFPAAAADFAARWRSALEATRP